MVLHEDTITRLHTIRKTLMQMLKDRGYLVGDHEINMSRQQFVSKFGENMKREDLTVSKEKCNDSSDQIYVFFPEEEKVGKKHVEHFVALMKKENVRRAIIVSQNDLTPIAWKAASALSSILHLEIFKEAELLVNVKEHVLVPEHTVLTADEKKTLLERYTLMDSQLPRIQASDPVARYFGLVPGQVVKIVHPSETAGRYVTYRCCV